MVHVTPDTEDITITYNDGTEYKFRNAGLSQSSYNYDGKYMGELELRFYFTDVEVYKPFKFSDVNDTI